MCLPHLWLCHGAAPIPTSLSCLLLPDTASTARIGTRQALEDHMSNAALVGLVPTHRLEEPSTHMFHVCDRLISIPVAPDATPHTTNQSASSKKALGVFENPQAHGGSSACTARWSPTASSDLLTLSKLVLRLNRTDHRGNQHSTRPGNNLHRRAGAPFGRQDIVQPQQVQT